MYEKETILWQGRPQHAAFLGIYLLQLVILAATYTLILTISDHPLAFLSYGWTYGLISQDWLFNAAGLALIVCVSLWFVWTVIKVSLTRYTLTKEQLFVRSVQLSGVRVDEIELYRIIEYVLLQPFYLLPFALANIVLISSDISTPRCQLKGIVKAKQLLAIIREQVEQMREKTHVTDLNIHHHGENNIL